MQAPSPADISACSAILREGSKSFHAASRLLPARVRRPATALYAFCRLADDTIDLGAGADRLDLLRVRLERAYAGRPADHAVDRAFSAVVLENRIPRAIPEALLDGFLWDSENRRCADFTALEAYAVRVAGTVGLMMALVMGVRGEAALARALDLGVAMQLTNVARDIGEDARMGRLYLPLDWLAEAGIDPEAFLDNPRFTPALGEVTRRLVGTAAIFYRRAEAGIGLLPADCRPAIAAAGKIYSSIGDEVARAGFDSVSRRAVVSRSQKLWRMVAATAAVAASTAPGHGAPPVADGRALIEAVAAAGEPRPAIEPRRFDDRVGALVDMFTRLEQRAEGAAAEAG